MLSSIAKWFLKWGSWKLYAIIGAVVIALWAAHWAQVTSLRAEINDAQKATAKAQAATSEAEGKLASRVAAEKTGVAVATLDAKQTESQAAKDQRDEHQNLILEKTRADSRAAAATDRLRVLAKAYSDLRDARVGGCSVPGTPTVAGGVHDTHTGQLRAADGNLIDGALHIAADANKAAADRNWLAEQYERQRQSIIDFNARASKNAPYTAVRGAVRGARPRAKGIAPPTGKN